MILFNLPVTFMIGTAAVSYYDKNRICPDFLPVFCQTCRKYIYTGSFLDRDPVQERSVPIFLHWSTVSRLYTGARYPALSCKEGSLCYNCYSQYQANTE